MGILRSKKLRKRTPKKSRVKLSNKFSKKSKKDRKNKTKKIKKTKETKRTKRTKKQTKKQKKRTRSGGRYYNLMDENVTTGYQWNSFKENVKPFN